MDANGNVLVVWEQEDGSNDQIFMSEYRNGSWSDPADLTDNISPDGQHARDPQVAMDANGNAIIVWRQNDGSNDQIFMSEYRNGSWSHPADLSDNISPDGQTARAPQVAMDSNGNAIIIWRQNDGGNNQIFMSEYRNGSWSHPADLTDNISPDGQNALDSQVAMDSGGNAIVVWRQNDGSNEQIFKSEYRNGSWSHPADLTDSISPDGQDADDPQVAMDSNGNAIVVWEQNDGGNYQTFMSEYRNDSWSHPADLTDNISPDGQDAYGPQVAMDSNGNVIVVWEQYDGGDNQIFMSEYRTDSWSHPADINDNISPDVQEAYNSQVAMDSNGNAIIVWEQYDGGNFQVFVSEYRNGSWSHPADLNDNISPDGQDAGDSQVAMDSDGNAAIVWHQIDVGGINSQIFMSEFR
jgi:mRNA-degrading endonuclease HigB of HigAB toxin-antitoxin module